MIITKRPKGNKKYLLNTLGLVDSSVLVFSPYKKIVKSFSGVALKITRSSDSTSMNIYFLPNGSIDWNTMESFVGSGDCYIDEVYLQTLGIKAYNTGLNSTKPRAIIAGVRQTDGLYFDGNNDYMQVDNYSAIDISNPPISVYINYTITEDTTSYLFTRSAGTPKYSLLQFNAGNISLYFDGNLCGVSKIIGNNKILGTWTGNGVNATKIYNGTNEGTATFPATIGTTTFFSLGSRYDGASYQNNNFKGNIKTLIINNTNIYNQYNNFVNGGI